MSQIDNILIQVRSLLQAKEVKLWLEPYYFEGIGSIESEIEKLAEEFSQTLGISVNHCKSALSELQDGAITKLQAREEFETTGVATFKVKTVRPHGSSSVTTIKCPLTDTGKELQERLSKKINVDFKRMKIICAGKVIQSDFSLRDQGVSNNQQFMVLIGEEKNSDNGGGDESAIYDRVRKAKEDAELILKSKSHNFFRMEDQDGNAVHLPPNETKAIMLALALYEKGRAAMKRNEFSEALVLFLEADEQFSGCNSKILETVDNYALLNLDIVWCYLCLKSFSQLPDAERRLKICQQNFKKSYGQNLDRVIALKGSSQNERALIMRLHLLEGILLFHQNRRNEAYEKLSLAENELKSLKVDEECFMTLLEMGYGTIESRIALRSCDNNVEQSINFIMDKRNKKDEARARNREEEKLNRKLKKFDNNDDSKWVNPRVLNTLVNMGFEKEMAFIALKMSDNNIQVAVDLLHNNQDEIVNEVTKSTNTDDNNAIVDQIVSLGFNPEMVRIALESVNNSDQAIELLQRMQNEGNYTSLLNALTDSINNEQTTVPSDQPGPSSGCVKKKVMTDIKKKIKNEMEALKAYERFAEDMSNEDDEYLDLPLVQEENILCEYKRLLEQ